LSGFDPIVGQGPAIRSLIQILKSGRIPHALLFTGIDGVGKRTAAVRLAMASNCTGYFAPKRPDAVSGNPDESSGRPCGQCSPCLRIAEGTHPDIALVKPEGGVIKIAQVRDLCRVLSMKPFEGEMRVAIIIDAHLMNPSSGNALLKILEEPPEQTLLILTARQTSDLLPTIVSRCQHIRFNPVSRTALSEALTRHHGFGADESSTVAALAGGSFSRALAMKHSGWMGRRDWLITELDRLGSSPIHVVLALSEKLSRNRDAVFDIFEIMFSWFRDLLIVTRDPAKVINQDRLDLVQKACRRYAANELIYSVNAIKTAQTHVEARTNVRLSMDHLLLLIWQQLRVGVTER
jgi:DNA polymerase-3 subunit delta'